MFQLDKTGILSLSEISNIATVLPMNISGQCLVDMACICYDPDNTSASLRSALASRHILEDNQTVSARWTLSEGEGSNATLPSLPFQDPARAPVILPVDINGDGRYDIALGIEGCLPACRARKRLGGDDVGLDGRWMEDRVAGPHPWPPVWRI